MVSKNICIIPARGGSKRIPQKNIIDLNGKPMIAWTIEAAKSSEIFERIIVSTDSEEIAKVSKEYGAEVPFLRENYRDDYSPVSMATLDALKQTEQYYNEEYDNVFQLMANCPLRNSEDILNAYNNFLNNKNEFQISVFKYGWMNPWWAMELNDKGEPKQLFQEELKSRSQDLPDLYCPTGAIWIAQTNAFKKEETFYGENYKVSKMNWENSIDIDDKDDLKMAEYLMNLK